MQKIATKVFIYSSIFFGIVGILLVLSGGPDDNGSNLLVVLHKILFADVFIILPSFALSLAAKYLVEK